VPREDPGPLRPHAVPHVAVEVVVPGQQEPPGLGERHARDSADDVVVTEHGELLVGSNIEQTTGRVVRARGEGVSSGEK